MMCTETSPRISFSRDLSQSEIDPPIKPQEVWRRDASLLQDSDSEFEFRICRNCDHQELCPADEIFSNGVILPLIMNTKRERSKSTNNNDELSAAFGNKMQNAEKEIDEIAAADHHHPKKSFWNFKRSMSLNRDARKSFVFSFPLLSRSNSTGSAKTQTLNDFQKQSLDKKQMPMSNPSSSSSPSSCCNMYRSMTQKPSGKKHENGGVRFIPVLSVPPIQYVSKFGLRNSSEEKLKKK